MFLCVCASHSERGRESYVKYDPIHEPLAVKSMNSTHWNDGSFRLLRAHGQCSLTGVLMDDQVPQLGSKLLQGLLHIVASPLHYQRSSSIAVNHLLNIKSSAVYRQITPVAQTAVICKLQDLDDHTNGPSQSHQSNYRKP